MLTLIAWHLKLFKKIIMKSIMIIYTRFFYSSFIQITFSNYFLTEFLFLNVCVLFFFKIMLMLFDGDIIAILLILKIISLLLPVVVYLYN